MTSRSDDPHRWGAFTMIAPLWRSATASRWFARDEIGQRFVWVQRFERDVDCSDVIERLAQRPATQGSAAVYEIVRAHCAGARSLCPAVVSELVPALSLDAALGARPWRTQRAAITALRWAAPALEAGLVRGALVVDAFGRVFVAFPASAVPAIPQEPAVAVRAFAALGHEMSEGLPRDRTLEAVLQQALDAPESFASISALDRALRDAGAEDFNEQHSIDAPSSLHESALAPAQLAQFALIDRSIREGSLAEQLTPPLVRALQESPLDANKLLLLTLLEPSLQALRERSVRDRMIDKIVLALVGPFEPTWIPLQPEATAKTATVDGQPCTLCPMLWSELQPTAPLDGREARYCVACARAVHAVTVDGEPHVLASAMCAFVRRKG
jgi:hypothetical protein